MFVGVRDLTVTFVGMCGVFDVVDMTGLGATTFGPCSVVQKRA